MNGRPRLQSWPALALLLPALAACVSEAPGPGYVAEIERHRAEREARLRAEDGWLSLVGLFWLEPGENRIGSDPGNAVVLPAETAPPHAGSLWLDGDTVRIEAPAEAGLTLDDEPVTDRALRHDGDGAPDVVRLGRLRMHVIRRGERYALRVRDPESPVRRSFHGLDYYPIDPAYRVEARLEPYDEPKSVAVPTVVGDPAEMLSPGRLRFRLAGAEHALEPLVGSATDRELFLIFRDETSGSETYGAGRYLYATLDEDGRAVVDFNKAYNPPCAFTHFATCPLPPPANRLPVAIRAGERAYGSHG